MRTSDYQRLSSNQARGLKVTITTPIKNGMYTLAAGTTATILRKSKGYDIETEPCGTCGVTARLFRVNYANLELIKDEPPQPETPNAPHTNHFARFFHHIQDELHLAEGPAPPNEYGRPLAPYNGTTFWEWAWTTWAQKKPLPARIQSTIINREIKPSITPASKPEEEDSRWYFR